MPNQIISDAIAAIEKAKGAENSATVLINSIAGRIQTAVDAAIANGATAAELAPVQDEINTLNAQSDALAAAVAANP